jgi:energy-coupling factor transport system permease protein
VSPGPLPSTIGTQVPSTWHRLAPVTRLVVAAGTVLAAAALGSPACLLLLGCVAVLVPAAVAGATWRLVRSTLALALPLAVSVLLVNIFLYPSGLTVVAELGPLRATAEGLGFALEVLARILVMAGATVLFALTTRPADLVADLQRHGVPPRSALVIHGAVTILPRLVERAGEVSAAQRARGLDTEGGPARRLRGVLPLAAPVIVGAIAEAETRTLALEARGFSRPGPRTLLRTFGDGGAQRAFRWAVSLGMGLLVGARLVGVPLPC